MHAEFISKLLFNTPLYLIGNTVNIKIIFLQLTTEGFKKISFCVNNVVSLCFSK